ncbi:MAG: radical SAM protein [Anaerolineaceae bacterium]|nr:radical SAM protein [Anaerolineaceae bacterium]
METLRKWVNQLFPPVTPIPAAVYHYQSTDSSGRPFRLHLRVEADGSGILIVNASTVLHLNQTAAELAYHWVHNDPEDTVTTQLSQRYRTTRQQVLTDYHDFKDRVQTLIESPDLDPVSFLDFARQDPYTEQFSAPLRLDCALTYKLPQEGEQIAPVERVKRELSTEEWKSILKKAWDAGIPHVVFTGGEPTLRPDLVDLVQFAEQQGQVSGLLTSGHRLTDPRYLHELLYSGLDHILLVLDPDSEEAWEALRDTLAEDIFVCVHLTVTSDDTGRYTDVLTRLAEMGAPAVSLSAINPVLKDTLETVRAAAAQKGLSRVWDLPVPYAARHPVAVELAASGQAPQGAGRAWLYVEPDGDVLPAQGVNHVLGNLLNEPWEKIWAAVD